MTSVWLNTKENKIFYRVGRVPTTQTEIGYLNNIGQRLLYVIYYDNKKIRVLNSWGEQYDEHLPFYSKYFDRFQNKFNRFKWSYQKKVSNWLIRLANKIYK